VPVEVLLRDGLRRLLQVVSHLQVVGRWLIDHPEYCSNPKDFFLPLPAPASKTDVIFLQLLIGSASEPFPFGLIRRIAMQLGV
jgi:hypothetical protein